MQRHAVHHCGHAEFAHAVVDVAPAVARAIGAKAQGGGVAGVGEHRAGQIGAAAEQLGQRLGERFERHLAGLAAGHGGGLGVRGQRGIDRHLSEVLRQVTGRTAHVLERELRVRLAVGLEGVNPLRLGGQACVPRVPLLVSLFRDHEGLVAPAQRFAGELDFIGAECLAVRLGGASAVGRAFADRGLAADQRGLVGLAGFGDGSVDRSHVVAVDVGDHVPAASRKTLGRVIDEPRRHRTVDADAVVVVQRDELVQAPCAGQCAGFVADAFHQAAVAHKHIGVVINDGVTGAVEFGGQLLFGQRHAHRVGEALAERAGGGLDTRCHAHFRVARRLAVHLAEVAQLAHRQVIAHEVQHRIQQHRSVAVAEHEAITIGPVRIAGVVLEVTAPQRHGYFCHAHGCAGMTGVGLLHGVHRQRADGIGHQGCVDFCRVGGHADP